MSGVRYSYELCSRIEQPYIAHRTTIERELCYVLFRAGDPRKVKKKKTYEKPTLILGTAKKKKLAEEEIGQNAMKKRQPTNT